MKAAALLPNLLRYLAACALVLVFGTSCQKANDDNACPHSNSSNTNGNTRGMDGSASRLDAEHATGAANGQVRSGEIFNAGGGDDGGISDDGDDEADKESSNRPRPGQ